MREPGAETTTVEQVKARRAGTGLRAIDPDRACPGYTLFSPMAGDAQTHLIDLWGNVSHTWQLPYQPMYGFLTGQGTLFYNGKTPVGADRFPTWRNWKAGIASEVDWQGRSQWEVRHPDHHHDGIRLRNGNVLLLCQTELPASIARRVRGGIEGSEFNRKMFADYVVETTTEGEAEAS